MQLTSNIAVLAAVVASAAPSIFALPVNVAANAIEAREYELDLEAREMAEVEARELEELELTARDLIQEYYEAREVYDELDARSFDDFNYLDARADAPAATPTGTSTVVASPSASPSPSPSATVNTPAGGPSDLSSGSGGAHGGGATQHHFAHMPSVLIHALTDEHHPKLKHYAEIQLHIFNTLVDLTDGEPNANGVKESAEVEKLAKEILHLKRWHRHHLHHGHKHSHKHGEHHHTDDKEGTKPAHEKHDGAKDATAPPASASGTPSASGAHHDGHHGHHHDLYHAKIHELKIGSHKADRYIARAKLHKDRLHLIALGPTGEHDEAYEAAVVHEREWLERHQKTAAHLHKNGLAADPTASGASTPSAPAEKKAEKPAAAESKTAPQGVKRRALRRRGFF